MSVSVIASSLEVSLKNPKHIITVGLQIIFKSTLGLSTQVKCRLLQRQMGMVIPNEDKGREESKVGNFIGHPYC